MFRLLPVFVCFAILLLTATPAAAHKVVINAFVDGPTIEGEVGFTDGTLVGGARVEVFGPDGTRVLETVTDDKGLFRFTATRRLDHRLVADLGGGHRAETLVPAIDLPESLGTAPDLASGSMPAGPLTSAEVRAPAISGDLEEIVARAVARGVRPLEQRLIAFENATGWRDVLGGIGYILGLTGIAFYFMTRRREGREA